MKLQQSVLEMQLTPFTIMLRAVLNQLQEKDQTRIFAQPVSIKEVFHLLSLFLFSSSFIPVNDKAQNVFSSCFTTNLSTHFIVQLCSCYNFFFVKMLLGCPIRFQTTLSTLSIQWTSLQWGNALMHISIRAWRSLRTISISSSITAWRTIPRRPSSTALLCVWETMEELFSGRLEEIWRE